MFVTLAIALVVYLALLSPGLGRRSYRRLERDRALGEGRYRRTLGLWAAEEWGLAAVALALVGLSPELDLSRIGLTVGPVDPAVVAGAITGLVLAGGAGALIGRRLRRRGVTVPLPPPLRVDHAPFQAMLPRTRAERRWALGLAVSAGACEEIVYRGLLIALGAHVLGLPVPVAAGLALAVFAAGHLYQGPKGMLMVTLAGLSFTVLYLMTGSLLLPIAAHALADVRSLSVLPASRSDSVGRAATVRG